jgi:L-asparaginase II
MTNPVLVEIIRGHAVESRHCGAVSVFDGDGRPMLALGDVGRPVFPRSAVKIMQALPLIESGAADSLGFGDKELALACASHHGEPEHAALAGAMLAKAGASEATLECGVHWPTNQAASAALAAAGRKPGACHNNCSGKHAGFICTAIHLGEDPAGYVGAGHGAQRRVADALFSVTGTDHGPGNRGIDGCSIPTHAVPLHSLAQGMARLATGRGLGPLRARAAQRLMAACMAEPFFTSGTNGFCTRLMQAAPGRLYAKFGAEGVYCAAIPELGFGIALKIDDGAQRAAEMAAAGVVARLAAGIDEFAGPVSALARRTDRNWNGIEVGQARVTDALGRA